MTHSLFFAVRRRASSARGNAIFSAFCCTCCNIESASSLRRMRKEFFFSLSDDTSAPRHAPSFPLEAPHATRFLYLTHATAFRLTWKAPLHARLEWELAMLVSLAFTGNAHDEPATVSASRAGSVRRLLNIRSDKSYHVWPETCRCLNFLLSRIVGPIKSLLFK